MKSTYRSIARAAFGGFVIACAMASQLVGAEEGAPETPSCAADVSPPAGDRVVNIDDLLAVINAWGSCPQPCPPSCSADATVDCSVNIDDLLVVINGWGACPCPIGPGEPNETCQTLVQLAQVSSNQTNVTTNYGLQSATDVDIFRFRATETDATCSCCDGGFCLDEDYQITVTLSVPAGGPAYRLCVSTNCATIDSACSIINPGSVGQRQIVLDGACPGLDEYDVFIKIASNGGPAPVCVPYTLQYTFVPGCF